MLNIYMCVKITQEILSIQKVYVTLLCKNNANSKNSKDNTIMSIQTIDWGND